MMLKRLMLGLVGTLLMSVVALSAFAGYVDANNVEYQTLD